MITNSNHILLERCHPLSSRVQRFESEVIWILAQRFGMVVLEILGYDPDRAFYDWPHYKMAIAPERVHRFEAFEAETYSKPYTTLVFLDGEKLVAFGTESTLKTLLGKNDGESSA
jgi:hypothetical protein